MFYTSTKSCHGLRREWVCVHWIQLHEIVEGLYFYISLSVCLCVCVSVCPEFLWTKFQPNGCTVSDAVFAKWLLTALAQTLLKLVTLGQRSRLLWPKMYIKMMKNIHQKLKSRYLLNRISSFDRKFYYRHFDTKHVHIVKKNSKIFAIKKMKKSASE